MINPRAARFLRFEAAALLAVCLVLYGRQPEGWLLFAILFLVPDLSMVGYLMGPRAGAWSYNTAHTYALPFLLAVAGLVAGAELAISIALIWAAHIAFDRVLGYGLKLPTGFQDTHLGRIGRGAADPGD